jgi:hypothetical protein
MVDKECNLRAGVYKVQTFGTTQDEEGIEKMIFKEIDSMKDVGAICHYLPRPSILLLPKPIA